MRIIYSFEHQSKSTQNEAELNCELENTSNKKSMQVECKCK